MMCCKDMSIKLYMLDLKRLKNVTCNVVIITIHGVN